MTPPPSSPPRPAAGAALLRWGAGLALWIVLLGPSAVRSLPDLGAGAVAAAAAAWLSRRLLPGGAVRLRAAGLARLAGHFARQSLVAGADVARRALAPRLPLEPGFIGHRPRLPAGPVCDAFTAWSSLLPGTLPVHAGPDGAVRYHCLDIAQPVAAQLARDEGVFAAAFAPGPPAPAPSA